MKYLDQVQRGIDFIEERLAVDLETADVAREAGISHWHFQRIFKALTNETLKTYIRSRRLAVALEMLLSTERRIIEIALEAGFQSQESFTRVFKLAFGITPAAYRQRGTSHQFVRKASFDGGYLRHLQANVSLEPELYEQPELLLVGMQTHCFGTESHKNNIARKLPALWAAFLERLDEVPDAVAGHCYGIVCPRHENADELVYLAAIAVRREAAVPPGMVLRRVPGGRYARFTHRGRVERVDQTVNYIYGNWLARSGLCHRYAADIEFYGADYHPTAESSVIRYAIPVQE
ncbi:MAG: helix-turn-helix domain-containing protein [Pseudomonadota bacterium]|nr:helix-turn-helix domain-containing protein [Pseudomonadota bacterium]